VGAALAAAAVAAVVVVVLVNHHASAAPVPISPSEHDVTRWAPPRTPPLSDASAAALVTHRPEQRPANQAANDYVPSDAQLAAFRAARNDKGRRIIAVNPLLRYVTGRPGLEQPSTDDLIQWASHKWGIPTSWIRAQVQYESGWHQSELGDKRPVSQAAYLRYPAFSRVPGARAVYESLGIAQVKWTPNGAVGAGTEPLRWESTAFNLDYYAATLRYFYDGDCRWCTRPYNRGQAWQTIGAWYEPTPWGNHLARHYIKVVKQRLAQHAWTKSGF
jgi:hypothetical protein